jgi:hypothetical protein
MYIEHTDAPRRRAHTSIGKIAGREYLAFWRRSDTVAISLVCCWTQEADGRMAHVAHLTHRLSISLNNDSTTTTAK